MPPEAGEDPATRLAAEPDSASEVGAPARLVDWEDPAWVVPPAASVEPPAAVAPVEAPVSAADGPASDAPASAGIDEVARGPEQPQTAWPAEVAPSPERREELSAEAGMAPPPAAVAAAASGWLEDVVGDHEALPEPQEGLPAEQQEPQAASGASTLVVAEESKTSQRLPTRSPKGTRRRRCTRRRR